MVHAELATLGIIDVHIEEGSGLSRKTKVTARQLATVLDAFVPHRGLLTRQGRALYKTGTLRDVKSLVGYLERAAAPPLRVVILLHLISPTMADRDRILALLGRHLPR